MSVTLKEMLETNNLKMKTVVGESFDDISSSDLDQLHSKKQSINASMLTIWSWIAGNCN